jgi:hypothetical protein
MDTNILKTLLYQSYALGFESGVNCGSFYKMDENWERQKYFFEKDIESNQRREESLPK